VSKDAEALRALYTRHAAGIRRYLARMVGEADADDLVHDVFERAQRAATPAVGELAAPWLYRIARNAAVDLARGRTLRLREDVVAVLGREDTDRAVLSPDVDLSRAQMRSCILDLVHRLAPSHRDVVVVSELGGLSDQETADALGVTLGAAKIRLHRARRALRELLERECHTFRDERNELACEPVGAGPGLRST
jgi:RNA polymerase sigma-70 factor (ECF subfamily)